jgi:UDP-4-amino-4,6-dideoxy-N-acetyl-beta-L-altrosamine N-acetyltransferase
MVWLDALQGLGEMDASVKLRPVTPEDVDMIWAWRQQPEVSREMFHPPPSRADHERWIAAVPSLKDRAIFVIEMDDKPVGSVGLGKIDPFAKHAEYGIYLGDKNARGRGVACRATEQILRFGFSELGLAKIYLMVFADNVRAVQLYKHVGFKLEGVLRRHEVRGSIRSDIFFMGILKEEFGP